MHHFPAYRFLIHRPILKATFSQWGRSALSKYLDLHGRNLLVSPYVVCIHVLFYHTFPTKRNLYRIYFTADANYWALPRYLNVKFVPILVDELLIFAINFSSSGECGSRILSQPSTSSWTAKTKVIANPLVIVNPKRTSSMVLNSSAYVSHNDVKPAHKPSTSNPVSFWSGGLFAVTTSSQLEQDTSWSILQSEKYPHIECLKDIADDICELRLLQQSTSLHVVVAPLLSQSHDIKVVGLTASPAFSSIMLAFFNRYSFCRSDAASVMKQWLAFRTQTEEFRPQAECWRWIDYPELFWPCCEPFAPRLAKLCLRVNKIPGNSVYLHQRAYAQSTPWAEEETPLYTRRWNRWGGAMWNGG